MFNGLSLSSHDYNAGGYCGRSAICHIFTNLDDNTVSVIDTATDTVLKILPVGDYPVGVAVNPSGTRAYVANSATIHCLSN